MVCSNVNILKATECTLKDGWCISHVSCMCVWYWGLVNLSGRCPTLESPAYICHSSTIFKNWSSGARNPPLKCAQQKGSRQYSTMSGKDRPGYTPWPSTTFAQPCLAFPPINVGSPCGCSAQGQLRVGTAHALRQR
jgi:hypothetical protein